MNPLPYSTSERRAGLATGPQLRYLYDGDLLPMRINDGSELLPALPSVPPTPEPPTFETRTPNRTPNREADLIVPAGQAAMLALAVLIGGGAVAIALGLSGRLVLASFGIALIAGWFWRQNVSDGLLWAVESATGLDLDHNGAIGRPAAQHAFTVLQPAAARETVARETREASRTTEHAALLAFVTKCYTRGTSEAAHGVKATGPDRAEYVRRRDVLMGLGVAAWKNPAKPRAGWQMVVSPHTARQIVEKHVLKST